MPPAPDISEHLKALLTDLDAVIGDFSTLITENKHRRWLHRKSGIAGTSAAAQVAPSSPVVTSRASRASFETTASEEFFDAVGGDDLSVGVLNDDDDDRNSVSEAEDDDGASGSDSGDSDTDDLPLKTSDPTVPASTGPRDLTPLPLSHPHPIRRRQTVLACAVQPPSLIGFLRKNVGKDLSTIAMPVSANEPTSLVQRLAEQLEYSELLDAAALIPHDSGTGERILLIAAFAVSGFSNARVKERAARKPFNPMLGETYELVREDKGFRFLAEKVCHRPVVMACQADAKLWSLEQSPMPTQKFWGKSAELNTAGKVRITFHEGALGPAGEGRKYSYTLATSFLRNVIAGEKYVEPVNTMTIHCDHTGAKAVVTFKGGKGMFAGRSEDVEVLAYDQDGQPYPYMLAGKWTSDLSLFADSGATLIKKDVWKVGSLVDNPSVRYGWTTYAAQLNEVTELEEGRLPPTDSRLRPDQRLVEEGRVEEAETVKKGLEERQRARRKVLEEAGETWKPRWFVKVREYADEEVWTMRVGEGDKEGGEFPGYWEMRKEGRWGEVEEIF